MRIAILSVVCTLAGLAFGQYGVDRGGPDRRMESGPYDGRYADWDREDYRRDYGADRRDREFDEERYFVAELEERERFDRRDAGWDEVELEGMLDDEMSMRDEDDDRGPPPPPPPHRRGFRGPGRGEDGPPPPPPHAGRRPPRHAEADDDDDHRGPPEHFPPRGGRDRDEDDDDDRGEGCPLCERLHEMHQRHFAHRGPGRDAGHWGDRGHRGGPARGPGMHHRGPGRGEGCPMCEHHRGFGHRPPMHHRGEFSHRMARRGAGHHRGAGDRRGPHAGRHLEGGRRHFADRGDGRGGECPHCAQAMRRTQHPRHGMGERGRGKGRHGAGDRSHRPPVHGKVGRGPHGGPGQPGPHGPADMHGPQHVFKMLDSDHDGKLSKDEVLKLHEAQDADHDGFVTIEEIGKHFRSVHKHQGDEKAPAKEKSSDKKPEVGKRGRGLAGPPMGHPGRGMMGMFPGHGGLFGMLPPREMLEKLFDKVDADDNGSVTKDEIAEAIWQKASAADDNKDGSLSKDEIRKHLRAHMEGARGDRPGRPRGPEGRPGKRQGKPQGHEKPEVQKKNPELTSDDSATESKPAEVKPVVTEEEKPAATEAADSEVKPVEETPAVETATTEPVVTESQQEEKTEEAKPTEPEPTVLPSVEQDKPVENAEPEKGTETTS